MILVAIIFLIALIYLAKSQRSTGMEKAHYRMVAIVLFAVPVTIWLISIIVMVSYQGLQ